MFSRERVHAAPLEEDKQADVVVLTCGGITFKGKEFTLKFRNDTFVWFFTNYEDIEDDSKAFAGLFLTERGCEYYLQLKQEQKEAMEQSERYRREHIRGLTDVSCYI